LVWPIIEKQVEALLFLCAPPIKDEDSTVFRKVELNYDFTIMTPELVNIFNKCYVELLQNFIATFAVDANQLPDEQPLWAQQAAIFDAKVLAEFSDWYAKEKKEFSEEYQAILELFPIRYKAITDHFKSIAPHENARLVMYSGHMLFDLHKVVKPFAQPLRVVSHGFYVLERLV
jgi:hypothetical protein